MISHIKGVPLGQRPAGDQSEWPDNPGCVTLPPSIVLAVPRPCCTRESSEPTAAWLSSQSVLHLRPFRPLRHLIAIRDHVLFFTDNWAAPPGREALPRHPGPEPTLLTDLAHRGRSQNQPEPQPQPHPL